MTRITVLGAGVVGLSTALKCLDEGYEVVIVAEHLPGDPKTIHYTSPWAGAHHVSFATDNRQKKMDRETFEVMWRLSGNEAEHCFLRLRQTEYYAEERESLGYALEHMPDFRKLEPSEIIEGSAAGVTFTTITIDTAVYLPYLSATFLARGGKVVRSKVQHISQVIDGAFSGASGKPDAVLICAGIGARLLGGVEDPDVYPSRGQTVLIRAPWIKFGKTISSLDGLWTYIIPRRSGDIILGGIKEDNDWYPHPRPEITENILERCLKLAPELVPPEKRANGPDSTPTVDDIKPLIIETGCGLRPGRKGGIRLETEFFERSLAFGGGAVPVVYNYGHAGYGYQSSWGSASIAVDLLKLALKTPA